MDVLIIDDNSITRRRISDCLLDMGYRVSASKTKEDALYLLSQKTSSLVIVNSSSSDGKELFTFCKRIKELASINKQEPPFIILLFDTIFETKNKGLIMDDWGIDYVIKKPFRISEFRNEVKNILSVNKDDISLDLRKINELDVSNPYINIKQRKIANYGSLAKIYFPELLSVIKINSYEGVLELNSDKEHKEIFFKDGEIINVSSNFIDNESLGNILAEQGKISKALARLSHTKMISSTMKQGETLIQMGCLTPQDLNEALQIQIKEKLLHVFSWEDGQYRFTFKKVDPSLNMFPLNFNITSLIKEGLKRYYDINRLEKIFKKRSIVFYPLYKEDFNKIEYEFSKDEKKLYSLINGVNRLKEIVEISELPEEETLRIIFFFLVSGIIGVEEYSKTVIVEIASDQPLTKSEEKEIKHRDTQPEKLLIGEICKANYPQLLSFLYFKKKTGVLKLESKEGELSINFLNGLPVKASSWNIEGFRLGDIMKELHMIDENIFELLLREMGEFSSFHQGEFLISNGYIDYEDLARAIQLQTYKKVLLPFTWETFYFKFIEMEETPYRFIETELDMVKVITEGVRKLSQSEIEKILIPYKDYQIESMQLSSKIIPKIFIDPDTIKNILPILKNSKSIAEFVRNSKIPFVTILQITYNLLLLEVVKLKNIKSLYEEWITNVILKQNKSKLESAHLIKDVGKEEESNKGKQIEEIFGDILEEFAGIDILQK